MPEPAAVEELDLPVCPVEGGGSQTALVSELHQGEELPAQEVERGQERPTAGVKKSQDPGLPAVYVQRRIPSSPGKVGSKDPPVGVCGHVGTTEG